MNNSYNFIPLDIDFTLLLHFRYTDVISICSTSKRFEPFLTNTYFWENKTQHDFGTNDDFHNISSSYKVDSKHTYLIMGAIHNSPIPGVEKYKCTKILCYNVGLYSTPKELTYFQENICRLFKNTHLKICGGLVASGKDPYVCMPFFNYNPKQYREVVFGYSYRGILLPFNPKMISLTGYYYKIFEGAVAGNQQHLMEKYYTLLVDNIYKIKHTKQNKSVEHNKGKILSKIGEIIAIFNRQHLIEKYCKDILVKTTLLNPLECIAFGYMISGNFNKSLEYVSHLNFTNTRTNIIMTHRKPLVYYLKTFTSDLNWSTFFDTIVKMNMAHIIDDFFAITKQLNLDNTDLNLLTYTLQKSGLDVYRKLVSHIIPIQNDIQWLRTPDGYNFISVFIPNLFLYGNDELILLTLEKYKFTHTLQDTLDIILLYNVTNVKIIEKIIRLGAKVSDLLIYETINIMKHSNTWSGECLRILISNYCGDTLLLVNDLLNKIVNNYCIPELIWCVLDFKPSIDVVKNNIHKIHLQIEQIEQINSNSIQLNPTVLELVINRAFIPSFHLMEKYINNIQHK